MSSASCPRCNGSSCRWCTTYTHLLEDSAARVAWHHGMDLVIWLWVIAFVCVYGWHGQRATELARRVYMNASRSHIRTVKDKYLEILIQANPTFDPLELEQNFSILKEELAEEADRRCPADKERLYSTAWRKRWHAPTMLYTHIYVYMYT